MKRKFNIIDIANIVNNNDDDESHFGFSLACSLIDNLIDEYEGSKVDVDIDENKNIVICIKFENCIRDDDRNFAYLKSNNDLFYYDAKNAFMKVVLNRVTHNE